jgi:hypothetical protein
MAGKDKKGKLSDAESPKGTSAKGKTSTTGKSCGAGKARAVKRSLLLLTVSAVLALALSESLRSKALDMMFGAEEEFDYSSTTAPATPAPAPETVAGG